MKIANSINWLFLISFPVAFLIVSCVSVNGKDNISNNIKTLEGYLLTTISIDRPNWDIALMPMNSKYDKSPFSDASAVFNNLDQKENYILIKLPVGKYTFKYIHHEPFVFEIEEYIFVIEPNMVNYIGSLDINITSTKKYNPFFEYKYYNDEKNVIKLLNERYPEIFNTYQIAIKCLFQNNNEYLLPKQII